MIEEIEADGLVSKQYEGAGTMKGQLYHVYPCSCYHLHDYYRHAPIYHPMSVVYFQMIVAVHAVEAWAWMLRSCQPGLAEWVMLVSWTWTWIWASALCDASNEKQPLEAVAWKNGLRVSEDCHVHWE